MKEMKIIDHFRGKTCTTAIISALICGVLTHLFGLVNLLYNCDNLGMQPYGYGSGVSSGRWLLSLMGDTARILGGGYNLPLTNGLLFIVLLALSSGVLVSTLKIKKRVPAALIGMLMVVFPSSTDAFFYRFTVVYYGIAILLSVLAVWVLLNCDWKYGLPVSAFFIALSLGIYQAYVPITISVFVLALLREALEDCDCRKIIRQGIYDCCALVLGLLLYYLLLKGTLAIYGETLNDYQGISSMGKIPLRDIPGLIMNAVTSVLLLPVKTYCGVNNMRIVKLAYLALGLATVAMIACLTVRQWTKRKCAMVLLLIGLLCATFILAVNFVVIMCPQGDVHMLMVHAIVMVLCAPLVVFECFPQQTAKKKYLANGIAFITAAVIFCYSYEANIGYTSLFVTNRQVENYWSSIVAQVRMTEGFDADKKWVFCGDIDDPLIGNSWHNETRYAGNSDINAQLNGHTRFLWLQHFIGYQPEVIFDDSLCQLEEIKEMPCWPAYGSIKVVDDMVVIKFQDVQNP